jgi:hypothetical protein
VTGRDVVLLDFSYKRPVLEKMIKQCDSLLVLDHHATAKEDLAFLPYPDISNPGKGAAIFDVEHSGAMLAWEHYHDGAPPELLRHIEDRDLWRFALPHTREIQAALASYPYDFTVWDKLMQLPTTLLLSDGVALERKQLQDISTLVPLLKRRMVIGGYKVWVANLPVTMVSDAGNLLALDGPFGACYSDDARGRNFALRSTTTGENFDVSKVAASYGGGGHHNAAGFQAPRGWEGDDSEVKWGSVQRSPR